MRVHATLLYTPISRVDSIINAREIRADMVVLDLEDSIPRHAKDAARDRMASTDLSRAELPSLGLRVNTIGVAAGLQDMKAVIDLDAKIGGVPIDTIFIPKISAASDVAIYRSLLSELSRPPQICSFIETVDAVENAYEIASRSDGLCFGQADLIAELYTANDSYLAYARARLCVAAAKYQIPAIDTNSFELWDMDKFRAECDASKRCGFTGKAAIHPVQVDIITETFTVSPDELDSYRKVIKDYEETVTGFTVAKDRVLAPPFALKARRMLRLYEKNTKRTRQQSPLSVRSSEDNGTIVEDSMKELVKQAKVDVSAYKTRLVDGHLESVGDELTDHVMKLVTNGPGVAICHGVSESLKQHGLDVHTEEGAAVARDYLESLFRSFGAKVDVSKYSPVAIGYDRIASMDVDGYNKNTHFTPNSDHTTSREFLTTKCVHFDAATPFIANIYGPNINIVGGMPIICDTRAYCKANNVAPKDLIELMPHSYNVAVKEQYTQEVLAGYSVAVDVDLANDLVMVVLNNEVTGGVAHAGSRPELADPQKPGKRPIRHIEYQFGEGSDLEKWYHHYGQQLPEPTLNVPEAAAHQRYHRGVETAVPASTVG